VGSAVLTAVATTVVSFLPVFTLEAAEGKLFKPLAYTKTFALVAAVIVALTIIPPFAHLLFSQARKISVSRRFSAVGLLAAGIAVMVLGPYWLTGVALVGVAAYMWFQDRVPTNLREKAPAIFNYLLVGIVAVMLSGHWMPLGIQSGGLLNFLFVVIFLGGLLLFFKYFIRIYEPVLRWTLEHKALFMTIPGLVVGVGLVVWLGFGNIFGFMPQFVRATPPFVALEHGFPGLGKEFMPDLDEGSFLYMPTTMPHASIGEALDVLQHQDMAFSAIPEIESVVGKIGRVESPLDPAPISMIETIINYKPEYIVDESGHQLRFKYDKSAREFARDEHGELIPDRRGRPFRNWREEIRSPKDIWDEIVRAGKIPGTTSAPRLQPIAARLVMLQSGMRAPMGVKIKGPDLKTIERVGLEIEQYLKQVPSIEPSAVVADRIVGKPYLEIDIDRQSIARYGITIKRVQDVIEVAIGGKRLTMTVEGRERYPVRVRYQRELRSTIEELGDILVPASDGTQVPLSELTEIRFIRGPMVIKSEDTFLVGYVIFDKREGRAEVDVVRDAQRYLALKLESGEFDLPAGVSYTFAGSYENQVRSEKKLMVVLPLALMIIMLIIYFPFKHIPTTLLVFSGIFVAWAGGFIMLWLYGQPWFMDFNLFGFDFRELFQIRAYNLSVAVWVGFLALFGIATDDGVIISTYLKQVFGRRDPKTIAAVREATVEAGKMRIRPALMTAATTLLALIPVLTSTGRGADIMVPMAIPSFGGMFVVLVRVLTVPVLYCWLAERRLVKNA
jgi:Cu(I)/Ag(I) efflux system membrane protein CusA/SilA